MNAQPNSPEHPEEIARRSETDHRGIVDNIPAMAEQGMKLSSQPEDDYRRAEFHSLNSMIGAPMEIGRFLPLAVAIAAAVKQVHQGGLIHKDIKPANILVSGTGDVRVIGFGTDWPLRPTHDEVMREYDRIWSLLRTRQIEDLVDLPLLTDPDVRDVLSVLMRCQQPFLHLGNKNRPRISLPCKTSLCCGPLQRCLPLTCEAEK